MQKKGKKAPLIGVIIAAALVLMLTIAGTILRMNSRGMELLPAFKSFMADTFLMNKVN